jgi:hypothetical protein
MLHMSETGAYTQEMLEPFSERLANLKEIMKRDSADGKHPEPIVRLMSRKLEGVGKFLPPPMLPILTGQNVNSMTSKLLYRSYRSSSYRYIRRL